jgi:LytR cell envelope-related transcriptional attenuator
MDLLLAFSLQDQVEKYGAYVGLAAFIGLAVLSLLYFAQARELKRLRDWAGRAPERAAELQARVVAQAEEAVRAPEVEPAVERSGTVGPAQPVAQPAAGNGRQAGTPAPIPMGPRPAVAMAAAAARAAAAPATVEHEQDAGDEADAAAAPGDQVATGGDNAVPAGDDRAAAPGEDRAAAAPAGGDGAVPSSDDRAAGEQDLPAEPGNGVPAQPPADLPPTTIPRATPRPQPKPQPVPAAPLRASTTRSATLPRRTPRPRRDDGSRTGLYTLIGIVVLAIAIFVPVYFMVLSGDDETTPPPNPIAEPGGTPTSEAGAGERIAAARPEKVVVVLNGTAIDGLASGQRDKLIAAGYVDGMIRIANSDDQSRQDSIVLYSEDERRQARDVARLLDISRMEEIDEETQALADSTDESGTLPADVTVVVGTDKAP